MTNIENILVNFKNKNYKEALLELNKILIIDPNSVEKLNLRGVILQVLKKPEEARKDWIKSLSINNKYFDAYFNLGNSYMDEKNYNQAEIYYNQAAICQPQNFKIYYQLGFLCLKKMSYKNRVIFLINQLNTIAILLPHITT